MKIKIVCLLISLLLAPQIGVNAQVARMATKAVTKIAGKKESKTVIKVLCKGVIKEIPVGKECLRVVRHADGSYTPVIHNLGKNASKYSDEFNTIILKERRKAITENYQIVSSERLAKTKRIGDLKENASAKKLRDNLYARMGQEEVNVAKGFGGTAAHHVIEGSDPAASKSREILKKFHIGINDAENGVLLPTDELSIYKGAIHNTQHSEKYSLYVYNKIKNVKSQQELISKLTEIKRSLVNGSLDLNGTVRPHKTKFKF